jgi:hypothetical protein
VQLVKALVAPKQSPATAEAVRDHVWRLDEVIALIIFMNHNFCRIHGSMLVTPMRASWAKKFLVPGQSRFVFAEFPVRERHSFNPSRLDHVINTLGGNSPLMGSTAIMEQIDRLPCTI